MKNIMRKTNNGWLMILFLLAGMAQAVAQAPTSFSYQSILRDASSNLLRDKAVSVRLSILQGSVSGTAVYTETHSLNSNSNGLVTLIVGNGTSSDNFADIDWSNGPYFIKSETDPTGGTTYTITGTSQLLSVPYALHARYASSIPVNPYEVYVSSGASGGDGTQAKPFGTIAEGYAALSAHGTLHILAGNYTVNSTLSINKDGVTLKGHSGAIVTLNAAVVPFRIFGNGVTIDGLTITSDAAYVTHFIQVAGSNHTISNNVMFGPTQSGSQDGWVVNRAFVTEGSVSNISIRNNIMHDLRQPAYLNPNGTGHITNNIVYNTKGFVVDQALFEFSGNSWGNTDNAADISLLVGTTAGKPYDNLDQLRESNASATISDQRTPPPPRP